MEDNELKAIQEAITRQATNNYPQIYIKDLQSGRVFEYGKNCHDRLVISEDGRSLHYENLQNGDGSCCGDYRFYYEKPKIETEMDKMHEWDLDHYARNVENKSLDKLADFEDFMEEQGFESLEELDNYIQTIHSHYDEIKNKGTCGFCEHLDNKENQALKDRWQKLKDFCDMLLKEYKEDDDDIDYCVGKTIATKKVLDKMQELEKEIK